MKKILSVFVCTLLLVAGAVEAKAALLTDWTYSLDSVSFDGSTTFTSGKYTFTMGLDSSASGNMAFTASNSSISGGTDTLLTLTVTENTEIVNTGVTELGTFSFTYTAQSVTNPLATIDITYSIPLYTKYDSSTGTAYIYYDNFEVSTSGDTAYKTYDYTYSIKGVAMQIDGEKPTNEFVSVDEPFFSSWSFTDTGSFDFTGALSLSNTYTGGNGPSEPAPTPEPATMLLMGLGLAGLGFVARRRNK